MDSLLNTIQPSFSPSVFIPSSSAASFSHHPATVVRNSTLHPPSPPKRSTAAKKHIPKKKSFLSGGHSYDAQEAIQALSAKTLVIKPPTKTKAKKKTSACEEHQGINNR
jgi:hypothetical protein